MKPINETFPTDLDDRMVQLPGEKRGLCSTLGVEAVAAGDEPVVTFTASDNTLDRYAEVIEASGWQLDNYRRNPVFLNSHNYSDILFTLGTAEQTWLENGKLRQRVRFAVDANPVARIAHRLYAGKFLNAVSVGFIPLEWENGTKETPFRRRYTKQELIEVSAVSVPANPAALAESVRRGLVSMTDIDETIALLDTLRTLRIKQFPAPTHVNPVASNSEAVGHDDSAASWMRALAAACAAFRCAPDPR